MMISEIRTKRYGIMILVAILMLLPACNSIERENTNEDGKEPISPITSITKQEDQPVMLFYQLQDEEYLVTQSRTISVKANETLDHAVLHSLFEGPTIDRTEMRNLFSPDLKLISITPLEYSKTLSIVLSREFYDPPLGIPDDWQTDYQLKSIVHRYRRLAVYSIVNTITEMGIYRRVLIQVEQSPGGEILPLYRQELGMSDSEVNGQLDPLGRNIQVLLTPENTLKEVMDCLITKDWERMHSFVATYDNAGNQRPALENFKSMMNGLNLKLERYEISYNHVSADGHMAVVSLMNFLMEYDSNRINDTNIPIKLIRENDVWKVMLDGIQALWETK